MGQLKRFSAVGLHLRHPVRALHDVFEDRAKRERHLAELKGLNSFFLEDIGLFEYTRAKILRSN